MGAQNDCENRKWYTKLICKSPNQAFLFFQVIIENPLVSHKDPEKGEKFCPMTPR